MKINIIRLTFESRIRIEYEVLYRHNFTTIQMYYHKVRNNKILIIKRNKHTRKTRIYLNGIEIK